MKIILLVIGICISTVSHCQKLDVDTCDMKPTQVAYFNGLIKGDSVTVDELIKAGSILSSGTKVNISFFVYVIDCAGCDFVTGKVFSDKFTENDIKKIRLMEGRKAIIFFECILARQNGYAFTHTPFFFFLK